MKNDDYIKKILKEGLDELNNEVNLSLSDVVDIEDLHSFFNDSVEEYSKMLLTPLKFDLLLAYLGVSCCAMLNYSINFNKECDQNINNSITRNELLSSLVAQITNYCFSIITLVERGMGISARPLIRVVSELIYLTIFVSSSDEKLALYLISKENSDENIWYRNFRFEKLNKELEKIELNIAKRGGDIVDR